MYEYFWGYTAAQIELMMADCPIIVYPDMKKKKKENKKSEHPRISGQDIAKAAQEWQKKYGQGNTHVELDLSAYSFIKNT